MTDITGIALVAVVILTVFTACTEPDNGIASFFEPIIGKWKTADLASSTLVFNANETCTETGTIHSGYATKNGDWDATGNTITRTWSDDSVSVLTYTFNSDDSEMKITASPDGVTVTYARQ